MERAVTWIDYDRDGRLDLFVSHYAVFEQDKVSPCGKDPGCNYTGVAVYCGPAGLPQESCRLYHNNGDGTFTDVSLKSGISAVKPGYPLTAAAADFDGDGWPDIYVACDTSPSLLFRNNRDGTFTECGLESGVSLSEDGQEQAGMGLGIGDYRDREIRPSVKPLAGARGSGRSHNRQGVVFRKAQYQPVTELGGVVRIFAVVFRIVVEQSSLRLWRHVVSSQVKTETPVRPAIGP
jgi:FG-GAP-like repeat